MIKKSLLTASLLLPLIAVSGAAYAGPQWNPTQAPWKSAQSSNQTNQSVSKPYAQYVAPQQTSKPQFTRQGSPKDSRFVGR